MAIHYIISTVQSDISQRYRTFPIKINKLHTFSEITQYLIKKLFMYVLYMSVRLSVCQSAWVDQPET